MIVSGRKGLVTHGIHKRRMHRTVLGTEGWSSCVGVVARPAVGGLVSLVLYYLVYKVASTRLVGRGIRGRGGRSRLS